MQPNEQPGSNWTYQPEGNPADQTAINQEQPAAAPVNTSQPVAWTASEFISQHKNGGWYSMLIGGVVALCGVVYFLTRDLISVIAIGLVIVIYLVLSNMKPKQRTYMIDQQGIGIDGKSYPYSMFKSFSVFQEGAIGRVSFIPLKRFMPEIDIYFPAESGQQIVDVLVASLPHDQRPEHGMDRIIKRLHL
jgi:hypothetical protein